GRDAGKDPVRGGGLDGALRGRGRAGPRALVPGAQGRVRRVLAGLLDKGRALAGTDLPRILQDRLVFAGQLRRRFADIDLLLAPVHPFGNPTAAELLAILKRPGGGDAMLRYTAPFDMSGSP